jgi:predicted ATPase
MPKLGGENNNRYIISGGPGSGKTTLVNALQKLGYPGFPEIARDLINQGNEPPIWSQNSNGGSFLRSILQQRILCHQQVLGAEIAYFDRGIPDSMAYMTYLQMSIPTFLLEAVANYRYNTIVFVAPPWEEIYSTDNVRRESFTQASRLYDLVVVKYHEAGYQIIELPKESVENRVDLVLNNAPTELRNDK